MRNSRSTQILISVFVGIACAAVVLSMLIVYSPNAQTIRGQISHQSAIAEPVATKDDTNQVRLLESRIAELEAQQEVLSQKVASLSGSSSIQPALPKPLAQTTISKSAEFGQYRIYLGTGSTRSYDWTEISSATVHLRTSDYGSVSRAVFEAPLSIISGEVHARIKDKTSGIVFHQSEIMHNTSDSTWRTSAPFALEAGDHQYVVELRSSSGEEARLDGARITLFTD